MMCVPLLLAACLDCHDINVGLRFRVTATFWVGVGSLMHVLKLSNWTKPFFDLAFLSFIFSPETAYRRVTVEVKVKK